MLTSFDRGFFFPPNTTIADNNKQADKVMQQGDILIIFVLEKMGQCEVPLRNNLLYWYLASADWQHLQKENKCLLFLS